MHALKSGALSHLISAVVPYLQQVPNEVDGFVMAVHLHPLCHHCRCVTVTLMGANEGEIPL